jgi:prepilin-type processing-associated H-X9-DG protein/prepilin-type N-terminal cleavage/methylation domain-containing protein
VHNDRKRRDGFTLTELSVLMAVGAILASVLAADLVQDRAKLLQQACAANMKHWGMAFSMYADDYNGTFFYDANGLHFSDNGSPVVSYFGTSSDPVTTLRTIRMCPARVGQVFFGTIGYQMPVGQYRKGLGYKDADVSGSPYFRGSPANYWPDLKSVAQPGQYLLMIEVYNTLHCGNLVHAVTSPAVGTNVDPLPSIARHGGSVNCLFGDFHVELVSSNNLAPHDAGCGTSGSTWFELN